MSAEAISEVVLGFLKSSDDAATPVWSASLTLGLLQSHSLIRRLTKIKWEILFFFLFKVMLGCLVVDPSHL